MNIFAHLRVDGHGTGRSVGATGILPEGVDLLQEVGGDFVDSVITAADGAQDKDVEDRNEHKMRYVGRDVGPDFVETEGAPDDRRDGDADALTEVLKFPSRHRAHSVSDRSVKQTLPEVVLVLPEVDKSKENAPDNGGGHKQDTAFVQGQADIGDEASHKQDGDYRHDIP